MSGTDGRDERSGAAVRRGIRRGASGLRGTVGGARHVLRRRRAPDRWTIASPSRLHLIPPGAVAHLARVRLPESHRGLRTGGDWDRDAPAIADLALTALLRARFLEGRSWEEAGLRSGLGVGDALAEAPGLGTRYVGLDASAVLRRGAELDALHASLARDGWLPHHTVGAPFDRELAVAIGRDGRIIRNSSGLHRLILAQLLDLPTIPVRVLTEHVELIGLPAVLRRH